MSLKKVRYEIRFKNGEGAAGDFELDNPSENIEDVCMEFNAALREGEFFIFGGNLIINPSEVVSAFFKGAY